jgi:subtilisin family serine protease
MRRRALSWYGVIALTFLFTTSLTGQQNLVKRYAVTKGKPTHGNRLLVQLTGTVTQSRLNQLKTYGTVHLVLKRFNAVAMTPKGPKSKAALLALPFVKFSENDWMRWESRTGTWDRDLIDTTNVEENGFTPNFADIEDPREVSQTGAGVHVAVIDTGLVKNWRSILPVSQVATEFATAFMGGGVLADLEVDRDNISNPPNLWERDTNSHGTSVASHIIGFYRTITDGTTSKRVYFDGSAPGARVIPLKVFPNGNANTWSSRIIAAIDFATSLKTSGRVSKLVINMSLSGSRPGRLERAAIARAISAGVIVVAAAANSGEAGMGWPGAYPEVISAGAVGWTEQWQPVVTSSWWWTQDVTENDTSKINQIYVAPFSARAIQTARFGVEPQQLDVLAPGQWTVAPGGHQGNAAYFFWSGTSFSSPLTAGVAALMLQKNGSLTQPQVEAIMKSTALEVEAAGSRTNVYDPIIFGTYGTYSWDTTCGELPCDAVGAGLLQADAALAATPAP